MGAPNERLNLEILALLLQIAWADLSVEAAESTHILEKARGAGLDEETVGRLDKCLAGEATLPPPDIGYLRQHKDEALAALSLFIGSEGDEDTRALLSQITELLG